MQALFQCNAPRDAVSGKRNRLEPSLKTSEERKTSPSLTITVQGVTAGQRHYILVDCWDNDQEIVIPAGWRLDREYRWFDRGRYKAIISHEQTSSTADKGVTISLKNDTLAVASVVTEDQIESFFIDRATAHQNRGGCQGVRALGERHEGGV